MADTHEGELAMELEEEFHEGELEGEEEIGMRSNGHLGGGLLGEEELEDEFSHEFSHEMGEHEHGFGEEELEDEFEEEAGEGEGWLGAIGNAVGSLLGEEELEDEFEFEDEGEQFFGKIGRFLKKAAPFLKRVAKIAAPLVGTAIGGPFGTILGKVASSALGEEELHEHEFEDEYEDEMEGEQEMAHEIASHELTHNEAVAEMMAEASSHELHEGEGEAMIGAAAVSVISPADRRALRRILPHMIKGTAILRRVLMRDRRTRIGVRAIPQIMRRTVKDLKRLSAKGVPITRRRAGRVAAKQVRRVLGSPKACAAAITRNVRVTRQYKRPRRRAATRRRTSMR
jgi:hypothetical protein